METAKKQTVVVEVMALVGGHLLLPKVKLSKYIPADHHNLSLTSISLGAASEHPSLSSNTNSASSPHITTSNAKPQSSAAVTTDQNNAPSTISSTNTQHAFTNKGKTLTRTA